QRYCECEECINIRKQGKIEAEKNKREKIREIYDVENTESIEYSELTFFHKLVLLTLFRTQTEEEFDHIVSLDDPSRSDSLSPTEQMDLECLKELFNCDAVIIDPDSRVEAFIEDQDFK